MPAALAPATEPWPRGARLRRRSVAIIAALAAGVPIAAACWVEHSIDALAVHLGASAGVPVGIGGVDADLTGTIRLADVALGDLVAADAIEASVSLDSL